MRTTNFLVPLLMMATLIPNTAQAQTERPWSVSFDAGSQLAVTGDAHGGGSGTVLTLPTSVTAKSYSDVYGNGFYWAAGLGYRLGSHGELRVAGSYTSKASTNLQVGTVANLPLFAKFDDNKIFGMDFGYRQYLSDGAIKPFVGASVGFARVDAINATLTVPAANVTLSNTGFYDSSTVPTFGFAGGVQYHLTDSLAAQVGVDLRWQNNLAQKEGLAGTGLQTINDESRRWVAPITAGLTLRF
ncbi:MAG: outer membrane beta-barrel protein [Vicinamibacterales bacterium]